MTGLTIAAFVIAIVAMATARGLCRRIADLEAEVARLRGDRAMLGPADATGEPTGWPLFAGEVPMAERR